MLGDRRRVGGPAAEPRDRLGDAQRLGDRRAPVAGLGEHVGRQRERPRAQPRDARDVLLEGDDRELGVLGVGAVGRRSARWPSSAPACSSRSAGPVGAGGCAISTSAPTAAAASSHARSPTASGSARSAAATGTTASSASVARGERDGHRLLAAGARQRELALGARELVAQQRAQLRDCARAARRCRRRPRARSRAAACFERRAGDVRSGPGRDRRACAPRRVPAMSGWFEHFGFAEVGDDLLMGAYPQDADDVAALVGGRRDARLQPRPGRRVRPRRARRLRGRDAARRASRSARRARRLRQPHARPDRVGGADRARRGWTRASASTCTAARAGSARRRSSPRSCRCARGCRRGRRWRSCASASRRPNPLSHQREDLVRGGMRGGVLSAGVCTRRRSVGSGAYGGPLPWKPPSVYRSRRSTSTRAG